MIVFAFAAALVAQEPVTLLYQPAIGSSYKTSMNIEQTGPMGDSTTSMNSLVKVLSFESGFYKLQSTTSDVKITGGQADTAEKNAKSMEKQTTSYVDKNFKIKIDPKDVAKDPASKDLLNGLTQAFSSISYPTKPVQIGETWTNSIDMGAMMKAMIPDPNAQATGKLNMVFKLVKADDSTISIDTTVSGTVNLEMSGIGSQAATMKFNGTSTSTMERATGTPIDTSSKMTMDMDIAGQAIAITQKITMKRIK
jgi:hypothetical protein